MNEENEKSLKHRFLLMGIVFSFVGSLLLLFPLLDIKKDIEDDLINSMSLKTGEYTQQKHLDGKKLGLWGFGLLATGFACQFYGFLNKKGESERSNL